MSDRIVTYEPDNSLKKGFFPIFKEIYDEFMENKWLTYQLFKRDFSALYKQSFIGFVWIFIIPVFNVAIFAVLNKAGIFNVGQINVPYPIFAIIGMSFWQLFSTGVSTGGSALTSAGDMIMRINFSKKSLVLATIGRPIISFFIQFLLVGLLFIYYGIFPSLGILLLPVVILPIIILTLGLALIMAILNAVVRDTGNLLTIALSLLMYLTPVLYAKPQIGLLSKLTKYNPMYYLLTAGRDLVLTGSITELKGFIISCIVSLVVFIVAIFIFHLTETRIAERI